MTGLANVEGGSKLSRSEREAMLREVTGAARAYVLRAGVAPNLVDDLTQECLLKLWELTEEFDPSRGAKWSTYAVGCIRKIIVRHTKPSHGEDFSPGTVMNPCRMGESDEFVPTYEAGFFDPDESEAEAAETAEAEAMAEMRELVRRQLSEPLLARLAPASRRLVEAVAFGGLSPSQVAEQLGLSTKTVKTNLQNAVRKMLGQTAKGSRGDHDTAAAKELLRELVALHPGWTTAQLRAEMADWIGHSAAGRVISQARRGLKAVSLDRVGQEGPAPEVALAG